MATNEDELAKAAAEALSAQYGEGVKTIVDRATKDNLPTTTETGTRGIDWGAINNASSVIQIGMFVAVVAKWAWMKFKTVTDKAALKQAAKAELTPPTGLSGEQRDRVIDTVIEKL